MEGINNVNIAVEPIPPQGPSTVLGQVSYLGRNIESMIGVEQVTNRFVATRLDLGEVRIPFYVLVHNTYTTNDTVLIDKDPSFPSPQVVPPGRMILVSPEGGVLYALGAAYLWIMTVQTRPSPPPIVRAPDTASLGFSGHLHGVIPFPHPLPPAALTFAGNLSSTYNPAPPGYYIQFDVNWHDAGSINNGADMLHIGETDLLNGNYVGVYPASGQFLFWSDAYPYNSSYAGTSALNTWITLGMFLSIDGLGNVTLAPRVAGVNYPSFPAGVFTIQNLFFGAIYSGANNNFELDNLTIGTAGWGTSDIFAANFNAFTIVPPFDSIVGTGLDASGGTLLVSNAGTDTYAQKTL
jgi:hypothetical protein